MEILIKPVSQKDWDFIYHLRTNKNFENNFYTKSSFSRDDHYSYLSKQEQSSNFFHWMIISEEENVGYVRILDHDVSIMIDEKYQSKGIGQRALELVEIEAKNVGLNKLVGRMMINNESCKKIFEKNGFNLLMYWFEKEI
jgi:RimJ/RimL family protein N-acetyltransferase